jgi:hypothetical protein
LEGRSTMNKRVGNRQFGLRVRIKYSLRRMRIESRRNGTAVKRAFSAQPPKM